MYTSITNTEMTKINVLYQVAVKSIQNHVVVLT